MKTILVIANETIGGKKLLDTVIEKSKDGAARVVICVPRSHPRHGAVIYDEAVFDAAQVRVDLARGFLRDQGIDAIGEVGDPDPYTAAMDAIAEYQPDEIVVSTLPVTSSGWLRRDLIERIADASGLPVEHVIVDIDQEGLPFKVTLVAANRTAVTDRLLDALKAKAQESAQPLFIVVVPQEGGDGMAAAAARGRLSQTLERMRAAGLLCAGMIGDPDPYTAIMNALQSFRVDEVAISTLAATRSGWMRADLIERVRRATPLPVEHIEAESAQAAA
jgi:hypothetical protein